MMKYIITLLAIATICSYGITKEDVYKRLDEQRDKITDLRCTRFFNNSVSTNVLETEYILKGRYLVKIVDLSLRRNIAYISRDNTYVKHTNGIIITNANAYRLYNSFEAPINYDLRLLELTHIVGDLSDISPHGICAIRYFPKPIAQGSSYKILVNMNTAMIEEVVEYYHDKLLCTTKYINSQIKAGIYCHIGIDTIINELGATTHWEFRNIVLNSGVKDYEVTVR